MPAKSLSKTFGRHNLFLIDLLVNNMILSAWGQYLVTAAVDVTFPESHCMLSIYANGFNWTAEERLPLLNWIFYPLNYNAMSLWLHFLRDSKIALGLYVWHKFHCIFSWFSKHEENVTRQFFTSIITDPKRHSFTIVARRLIFLQLLHFTYEFALNLVEHAAEMTSLEEAAAKGQCRPSGLVAQPAAQNV